MHLGGEVTRPALALVERAGAERDPLWDRLKLAPGTEKDPGALGAIPRSGRTLRTPTFLVNAGKIFYLVRGIGRVFASVDGHVMIAGPLHARVIQPVKAGSAFRCGSAQVMISKLPSSCSASAVQLSTQSPQFM